MFSISLGAWLGSEEDLRGGDLCLWLVWALGNVQE